MKNLLLIYEIFSLCCSDAMYSSEFQNISKQKLIPAVLYTVPIDPPVQVLQISYKDGEKGKVHQFPNDITIIFSIIEKDEYGAEIA